LFGTGWGGRAEVVALDKAHEVYQHSRIGLNISLDNNLECYSSDRIFRILGCGALLLTKRFPGMSVLGLEHGKNCLVFDTVEEAVELVRKTVPTRVAEIAAAGAQLAREHHTWAVRMQELQAYVDAVRGAR